MLLGEFCDGVLYVTIFCKNKFFYSICGYFDVHRKKLGVILKILFLGSQQGRIFNYFGLKGALVFLPLEIDIVLLTAKSVCDISLFVIYEILVNISHLARVH